MKTKMPPDLNVLRKRARDHILLQGSPRLKVFLIVTATLVTGLGTSFLLLKCGVQAMWLRYSLAALFAYAAFFLYMRILIYWFYSISHEKDIIRQRVAATLDNADGDSVGDAIETAVDVVDAASSVSADSGGSGLPDIGDLFSDGDAVPFVIGIIILFGIFISSFYVVYIAPELIFEITFEALVSVGFYRMAKREQRKDWMQSTFRATIWPFVITLVLAAVGGLVIQMIDPEAIKMRDLFHPAIKPK